MATSIPSSMSFEMLSRLPANSFVQTWKEIRPDQAPQQNQYDMSLQNNIRFVLRGAPNEFALNTNMYVCGSANLNVALDNSVTPLTAADVATFLQNSLTGFKAPINFFDSSRESFNAGALPYLDNQDPQRSNVITYARFSLARRNRNSNGDIQDLKSAFSSTYANSELEFITNDVDAVHNGQKIASGVRVAAQNGADYDFYGGDSRPFQIPLGTYSNFVNSHSVIPLGLLSSYAVNGWQIELKTTQATGTLNKVYEADPRIIPDGGLPTDTTIGAAKAFLKDIRIYVPIVRVLDPSVMSAVLSLYEKQEQVAVGGVQFPLSLRINSMAYRFANFPLVQDQKDYFFRIAGTDRSVRAVAWWIYNTERAKQGEYTIREPVRVTRLETHIGSEQIHDVVEDTDENSSNVSNFISMNAKRSACLFSPLPYYQEGRKFDGQQDDDLLEFNNTKMTKSYNYDTKRGVLAQYTKSAVAYGVISMENLDRREAEYSGSFQASGKDLTNVGAIEMRMRIEKRLRYVGNTTKPAGASSALAAVDGLQSPYDTALSAAGSEYQIVFAYAYDSVMEVSPQGVMDVTNAVL